MKSFFYAGLVLCFFSSASLADELRFQNGDRLVGKIVTGADGKLTVESVSAGKVVVDLANLQSLTSDADLEIQLKDGSRVHSKTLPTTNISFVNIAQINPPEAKWTGSLSAGASITRGNSVTQNTNIDLAASRRSDTDRISLSAGYLASRQEDPATGVTSTTKRSEYGGAQYDYFFNKTFYTYANARAEKDAIALIDLRFTAGAGAGYQILETADLTLSGEAGISWLKEDFSGPTETNETGAGRLAYNLNAKLNPSVSFFHNAEWYESFEDFEDQYAKALIGLRASLTATMFAEVKTVISWDSTPATGRERTDVTYTLGVGWSF